jgi:hypothetical protein
MTTTSTAYDATSVTINNHENEKKRLSMCQGCSCIVARGYESFAVEGCHATPDGEGEHVWEHVNQVYIKFDKSSGRTMTTVILDNRR